ncbi:hypothetical protein JW905_10695 [bacterium]|nr:hypothetical protein [candidate division CSSED10-310 bacterium]
MKRLTLLLVVVLGVGGVQAAQRWIEPETRFSTYFGGEDSEMIDSDFHVLAVDVQGYVWLIGNTWSYNTDFPIVDPLWPDALSYGFVARFSPDGELVMSTMIGQYNIFSGCTPHDICALQDGGVVIIGDSLDTAFPMVNPNPQYIGGGYDAFIIRLGPDGREVVFATLFGGPGWDQGYRIAESPDGCLWIAGEPSRDFPLVNPVQEDFGWLFVAKLSGEASECLFSSYFGNSYPIELRAFAATPAGGARLAGYPVVTSDFPLWNPYSGPVGEYDAFIAGFDVNGTLEFSTLFGTVEGGIGILSLAVESGGDFWVAGSTIHDDLIYCA